ncbi:hypothetical protein Tco_0839716 [Tanacetum coccineum]|uniref:Uncharacterized protein n=1 Tax=Tanacetum coccineum TaxID=301880 RepID=A0ABQ5ATA4_9ASTR
MGQAVVKRDRPPLTAAFDRRWPPLTAAIDPADCGTRKDLNGIGSKIGGIEYYADRLRKLRSDKAWATIEELALYEDEGWNDVVILGEESLNYENPDIKQLLGIMERKVDTLIFFVISLMGRSEGVFRMTTNKMYQPPSEPSRQEEFEHIMMNFILDQEERVEQLKEYMIVITGDFMQLSSEVTRRLKDKIREEWGRLKKIEKITKYPDKEVSEPLAGQKFPQTLAKKTFHDTLKSIPMTPLWIRYVQLNFSNPPRFRKSAFSFKPSKKANQNVKTQHDKGNSSATQPTPHNCPNVKDDNSTKSKTPSHYSFTLMESNRVFDLGGR